MYRRIFAWIARSPRTNELECHVLLCKTSKRARFLAELLARAFHDSYVYRQRTIESKSLATRCSLCDTINRQNPTENHRHRPPLFRSRSHDQGFHETLPSTRSAGQLNSTNYERTGFHGANIARAFSRSHEGNSMNSSTRRSIDNDTTLADEESIKPIEYYRG